MQHHPRQCLASWLPGKALVLVPVLPASIEEKTGTGTRDSPVVRQIQRICTPKRLNLSQILFFFLFLGVKILSLFQ
jgi:hypothetical protein